MGWFSNSDGSAKQAQAQAPAPSKNKELIIGEVNKQIYLQDAQELLNAMSKTCFAKCVGRPRGSLSFAEQSCIDNCASDYKSMWNAVFKIVYEQQQQA